LMEVNFWEFVGIWWALFFWILMQFDGRVFLGIW
jgi:hypothetical protein